MWFSLQDGDQVSVDECLVPFVAIVVAWTQKSDVFLTDFCSGVTFRLMWHSPAKEVSVTVESMRPPGHVEVEAGERDDYKNSYVAHAGKNCRMKCLCPDIIKLQPKRGKTPSKVNDDIGKLTTNRTCIKKLKYVPAAP